MTSCVNSLPLPLQIEDYIHQEYTILDMYMQAGRLRNHEALVRFLVDSLSPYSLIIQKWYNMLESQHYNTLTGGFAMNCVKVLISILIISVFCYSAAAQSTDKEKEAVAAATAWLKLIDDGDYGQSWEESAEYFRNAVPKGQWQQQLSSVRKPLGKLIDRKLKSAQYTSSLPGTPDGEYVVIQFETSFESKKSSVETVTPMKEASWKWRVSGYYIK